MVSLRKKGLTLNGPSYTYTPDTKVLMEEDWAWDVCTVTLVHTIQYHIH